MSEYKHKMVNGELVELTKEEIAELEARDKQAQPEPEKQDVPRHSKRH